jgi:hypothetical protein
MTATQLRNLIDKYEQERIDTKELLAMYRMNGNDKMVDRMYERLAQISTGIGFYNSQLRYKEA